MSIYLAMRVTACGIAILLAGCGTSPKTNPQPVGPGATNLESPIPAVKNPRDVTAMARRPCELLTTQQATKFGLDTPPEQLDGLFDTLRCKWTSTTRDRRIIRTVDISMFTNNPTLEVAYDQDRRRPFFDLIEIAGYPVIVTRPKADLPVCDIVIKPAERQSVTVSYDSDIFKNNPQQSCEVGKQVAAAVIMNLPLKR
ncbi:MAG TPA: DUF3558 domain-containing protein [Pseudonocardiaceae bacterium]|jgi:hypothetical protein